MQTDWTEFLYNMISVGNVSKGHFSIKYFVWNAWMLLKTQHCTFLYTYSISRVINTISSKLESETEAFISKLYLTVYKCTHADTKSNLQWHYCRGCLAQPNQQHGGHADWLWLIVIVPSLCLSVTPYQFSFVTFSCFALSAFSRCVYIHSVWLLANFWTWFQTVFWSFFRGCCSVSHVQLHCIYSFTVISVYSHGRKEKAQ